MLHLFFECGIGNQVIIQVGEHRREVFKELSWTVAKFICWLSPHGLQKPYGLGTMCSGDDWENLSSTLSPLSPETGTQLSQCTACPDREAVPLSVEFVRDPTEIVFTQ
jgi:hypothetical protein